MQKHFLRPPTTSIVFYAAAVIAAAAEIFWGRTTNKAYMDVSISVAISVALLAAGIVHHIYRVQKIRRERAAHIRKLFEQKWEWQRRERTKPRSLAEEYPLLQREPTARLELNNSEIEINVATLRRAPSLFGDLIIKAALSDRPSKRPLVKAELDGVYKIKTDGFKYDFRNDLPGRHSAPRF